MGRGEYVDLQLQREHCLGLRHLVRTMRWVLLGPRRHAQSWAHRSEWGLSRSQGVWSTARCAWRAWVGGLSTAAGGPQRPAAGVGGAALILWGRGEEASRRTPWSGWVWRTIGSLPDKTHCQGRRTVVSPEEEELGIHPRGWVFCFPPTSYVLDRWPNLLLRRKRNASHPCLPPFCWA